VLIQIATGQPAWGKDRLVEGETVALADIADQKLQARLTATFRRIDAFEGIRVKIENGVIELGGQTSSFAAAEKAVDLAARFEGVLYVVDKIEVETELDTRLTPAWRKIAQTVNNALEYLPLAGVALLIFAALYLAGWLLTAWERPYRRFREKILLKNLVRQLIRYAFALAGLLVGLEILELTSLIGAVVGAAGLFGFRDWIAVDD